MDDKKRELSFYKLNKEIVSETVPTVEVAPTVEVILNIPPPEREDPGHNSRDFNRGAIEVVAEVTPEVTPE